MSFYHISIKPNPSRLLRLVSTVATDRGRSSMGRHLYVFFPRPLFFPVYFDGIPQPIHEAILSACSAAHLPLAPDMNTRTGSYGAGRFAGSVAPDGSRHSTAHAYLTADVLARPNLSVAVNAHVEKVLFAQAGVEEPRAVGVQLSSSSIPANKFRVRAKREVILSAGAIATPHLLLLSGLGPKAELESVGVPVVKDLPAVGRHFMDHMSSGPIVFEVRLP